MGLSSTASQMFPDSLLGNEFRVRNNKNLSVAFRGRSPARAFSLLSRSKWSRTLPPVESLCFGIWIPLLNENPTTSSSHGLFPPFAASVADTRHVLSRNRFRDTESFPLCGVSPRQERSPHDSTTEGRVSPQKTSQANKGSAVGTERWPR